MVENLLVIETEIQRLPPLKNKLIDFNITQEHLQLSGYEPHTGLRPHSKHWRKPCGNGCFHITKNKEGKTRIHWDAWDPRRFPIKHLLEVAYRYFRYPIMYLQQP